ncbi:hypothetical protein PFICI_12120 [Pestalotiopsis fici W106-1]|uniref:Apple domain-containing protein n=1 Tax=Pestalotiopsis fici (strain W106-1 / CGMCC3.15140) TaxID=1229662 RepID=W3WSB2_PESFW|nr:uncharacterized protein PFICI_12120 [Pestalotiopsis fici W106-1]ETS76733.1 hypothetical protein PFICI_12120 [Pestalotiopsis fici W106-1]
MQSPAMESEAPELYRDDGQFKEVMPSSNLGPYQQQVDPANRGGGNHQSHLEAVRIGQVDPEVLGYGTYSSTGTGDPQLAPTDHDEPKPAPSDQKKKRDDKKRIWGLTLPTLIFIIVVAVIVIGASIGGALGGLKATKDRNGALNSVDSAESRSLSTQPKATATTAATATVTTTQSADISNYIAPTDKDLYIHIDCAALEDDHQSTQMANGQTYSYSVECGKDIVRFTGDVGIDIFAATTYTFEDCLMVCSSYNQNSNSTGCKAIAFNRCE